MLGARKSVITQVVKAQRLVARDFSGSAAARAVQLFDMPAMSPTMEEGGIVEWKVEPGKAFKAGDVLLEIETDKAEIAVEAGDDGVLAKILAQAGEKGIPVGRPIAVTAEEGDDISSIDYDALLSSSTSSSSSSSSSSSASAKAENSESTKPAESSSATTNTTASTTTNAEPVASVRDPAPSHGNHGLEPLPAALRLMHENGLSTNEIKGSGPFGRITKGDVLAHLGKIPKEYPAKEQARFDKLQKMDLSNVEVAPAKPAEEGSAGGASAATNAEAEKPKPLLTNASIPLTPELVPKVAAAQRTALRKALLSLQPKPSVLRDPVFDNLTAPTKPPFVIKSAKVTVLRAKPVSLDVMVQEPPAAKPSKAVNVFFETLISELAA